jgi:hypothetical protein
MPIVFYFKPGLMGIRQARTSCNESTTMLTRLAGKSVESKYVRDETMASMYTFCLN